MFYPSHSIPASHCPCQVETDPKNHQGLSLTVPARWRQIPRTTRRGSVSLSLPGGDRSQEPPEGAQSHCPCQVETDPKNHQKGLSLTVPTRWRQIPRTTRRGSVSLSLPGGDRSQEPPEGAQSHCPYQMETDPKNHQKGLSLTVPTRWRQIPRTTRRGSVSLSLPGGDRSQEPPEGAQSHCPYQMETDPKNHQKGLSLTVPARWRQIPRTTRRGSVSLSLPGGDRSQEPPEGAQSHCPYQVETDPKNHQKGLSLTVPARWRQIPRTTRRGSVSLSLPDGDRSQEPPEGAQSHCPCQVETDPKNHQKGLSLTVPTRWRQIPRTTRRGSVSLSLPGGDRSQEPPEGAQSHCPCQVETDPKNHQKGLSLTVPTRWRQIPRTTRRGSVSLFLPGGDRSQEPPAWAQSHCPYQVETDPKNHQHGLSLTVPTRWRQIPRTTRRGSVSLSLPGGDRSQEPPAWAQSHCSYQVETDPKNHQKGLSLTVPARWRQIPRTTRRGSVSLSLPGGDRSQEPPEGAQSPCPYQVETDPKNHQKGLSLTVPTRWRQIPRTTRRGSVSLSLPGGDRSQEPPEGAQSHCPYQVETDPKNHQKGLSLTVPTRWRQIPRTTRRGSVSLSLPGGDRSQEPPEGAQSHCPCQVETDPKNHQKGLSLTVPTRWRQIPRTTRRGSVSLSLPGGDRSQEPSEGAQSHCPYQVETDPKNHQKGLSLTVPARWRQIPRTTRRGSVSLSLPGGDRSQEPPEGAQSHCPYQVETDPKNHQKGLSLPSPTRWRQIPRITSRSSSWLSTHSKLFSPVFSQGE